MPVPGCAEWGSPNDSNRLFSFCFHKDTECETMARAVFTFNLPVVRRIISPPQLNKLWSSHDARVYTSCVKTAT